MTFTLNKQYGTSDFTLNYELLEGTNHIPVTFLSLNIVILQGAAPRLK